jgi:hypothetical protein
VTDRYCRNCGHELAETDRFYPNCGTPVQEAAHVPTPEADVDVPSPPPQARASTPPPDAAARDDFPVMFFTVAAAVGGSVSASLAAMANWYPEWSVTNAQRLAYLAFALFLGVLLPVVLGVAFGFSVERLRPLPSHSAVLTIGTFLFGIICVITVTYLIQGAEQVVNGLLQLWHPDFVLIPAGVSLTTAMFYTSSAFLGHAWRRQRAGESARTWVREASDQPRTQRQQAMAQLSGENWTPRQQAMVGLIGTITAALIGLFGTLVTVFFNTNT